MIRRYGLFLILFLTASSLAAAPPVCSSCGKRISGRYIKTSDGRSFCNKTCAEAALPKCSYCQKPCGSRIINAENRVFCSSACAENALLPHCSRCDQPFRAGKQLPTPYGTFQYCLKCAEQPGCFVCERHERDLERLPDGRYRCRMCGASAVRDFDDALKLFHEVRARLVKKLNFRNDHAITLRLEAFNRTGAGEAGPVREFGLYMYNGREIYSQPAALEFWKKREITVRRENESCLIVALDNLPRVKLAEVLAHELAHDYMQHRWPYIQDEKIREGFAEAVAAEYNRLTNAEKWNYRMEKSPDPIYGDGYRLVRAWQQKGGWPAVARRLEAENQAHLPPELQR